MYIQKAVGQCEGLMVRGGFRGGLGLFLEAGGFRAAWASS